MNRIRDGINAVDLVGIFNAKWQALTTAFNTAKDALWKHVYQPVADIMTRIQSAINSVNLQGAFSGVWNGLVSAFNTSTTALWGSVWTPVVGIFNRIIAAIQSVNLFDQAFGAIYELSEAFNSWADPFFNHVWSVMTGIGGNIINGLIGGLQNKWNEITRWFGNLGSSIPNWVRQALGIYSPSKVFMEIGQYLMEGLKVGVEKFASQPEDALRGVSSAMADQAMQAVGDTITNNSSTSISVTIPNSAPIDDPDGAIRRYSNTLAGMFA